MSEFFVLGRQMMTYLESVFVEFFYLRSCTKRKKPPFAWWLFEESTEVMITSTLSR